MTGARLLRSFLFVPAADAKLIDSAAARPCDADILDLEDGTHPAAEVAAATSAPDTLEKFAALGVEPLRGGPAQLVAMVKDDIALWAPIVKASGAAVD